MKRWAFILLPAMVALLVLLAFGLTQDPRAIPSPLIGKPFPLLHGKDLNGNPVSLGKIKDRPLVINVWASWCTACRQEHATLVRNSRKYADQVELIGVDYKDTLADAQGWLGGLGNPYEWVFFDNTGRAGIELGVYGVPETFFVNKAGIIINKYAGPVTDEILAENIAKLHQVKQ